MERVEKLAPSLKRQLYELCWQFEDAWSQDNSVSPESWSQKVEGIDSEIVLAELTETRNELETRSRSERQLQPVDADRYEFVEEIARGGAAVIWRVNDHHLRRQSAVKYLLDSHDNLEMRSRLRREARICAKLVHPGIVPIYELSSFVNGRPFVCMKLIEGKTLLQIFKETPPKAMDTLLEIFVKACQAVAFAHQQNIIHRDLTPSNIMVGPFGEVQIMDWGLAKDLNNNPMDSESNGHAIETTESAIANTRNSSRDQATIGIAGERTSFGSVFGTIAYLSPEQACGLIDQVDKRSDVFSLGAILCRLLTGAPPYQKSNQEDLLASAKCANLADAYQRLYKSKDRGLAQLAMKCLSSNPDARPKDASAIVVEIDRIRVAARRKTRIVQTALVAVALVTIIAFFSTRTNFSANSPGDLNTERSGVASFEPVTDPKTIRALLDAGQLDFVLKSYVAALKENPADVALHYMICATLINVERYEEAETVAAKVVQIDSTIAEHHCLLSDAQFNIGKFDESIASLEQARTIIENGSKSKTPIVDKIAQRNKQLELSKRLNATIESNIDAINCEPADYPDLAKICQITRRYELAVSIHNKIIDGQPDPAAKSFARFHLLSGFIRRSLARADLSMSQRNHLYNAGLNWLSQQLEFATMGSENSDPAEDAEDAQEIAKLRDLQIDLLSELRERESGMLIRSAIADPKIEPTLKQSFEKLMAEVKNAK